MSYGYVLHPAQGSGFQVASSMLFHCLRFEHSSISWPSHVPRGEKENASKVSRVVKGKGQDKRVVLVVLWGFSPWSLHCFNFLGDKPCSSLEELCWQWVCFSTSHQLSRSKVCFHSFWYLLSKILLSWYLWMYDIRTWHICCHSAGSCTSLFRFSCWATHVVNFN